MAEPVAHVFTVRGRPVGFVPDCYGGSLVAIERGPFPISPTGYRSLAGNFCQWGTGDPALVSPEFLESLALANDKERRALLIRLHRAARTGDFVTLSLAFEKAVAEGFFAPDEERVLLWQGAYRLLCLVDRDPRFQPKQFSASWTPQACAEALESARRLLRFVEQLATGIFPTEAPRMLFGAQAYFELPPRKDGEKRFALPVITADLAFDLPAPDGNDEEDESETAEVPPSDDEIEGGIPSRDRTDPLDEPRQSPSANTPVQLPLF